MLLYFSVRTYHTYPSAWFNLSNEVDVTVSNIGDAFAGASNVSLYANDEFIGKLPVSSLSAGSSETVQFNWIPVGCDCADGCDPVTYTLKAIADCDGDVVESDETNNESTTTEDAFWNGYAADEPLENIASGRLNGGLIYTTGTGAYTGLYTTSASMSAQYDIALPDSATVELARLNVYYTWVYPKQTRPEMEVSITNQTGTYVLTTDRYYDDRKCWGSWDMYWGNWVYDVTPYIRESDVYSVTVKNVATGSVCPAGPGIVILYRDDTKPLIDYWINEGGDVLEARNGRLRISEAITNASFDGSIAGGVANATLGLVNPWANSYPDGSEVFFNGISLGQDVYCGGYGDQYYCSRSMSAIDMETNVGDCGAQVAISLLDVKDHLNDSDNYAGMGDIKDLGALPANAFLVVEYGEEKIQAGVRIEPEILNLDNEGVGIFTAFITLPDGYDVADINVSTVVCEGAPAQSGTVAAADNGTYVVNFGREDVREDMPTGNVSMTVEGNLFDGTPFEGGRFTVIVMGDQEWIKTFGGHGNDYGNSVQRTSDGGYIIAGSTSSYGAGGSDAWLIKTDSNGKKEWSKTFGGSASDSANSVQQTPDGGYIIAGYTSSYGAGGGDAWLIKTDSNGNEQWNKTFGGAGNDYGNSVDQTSDGGYTVVGHTYSYGAGSGDAWLIT